MQYIDHLELINKYPDAIIIKLSLTKYTIIDSEFSYLKKYSWHINSKGYVKRTINLIDKSKLGIKRVKRIVKMLHHEILPPKAGMDVDHINGNKLDNRSSNLRYATHQQNLQNRKPNKGNLYKGTSPIVLKNTIKYRASICGKHLGLFNTEIEAAKAYNEQAKKLYGEFACLNQV